MATLTAGEVISRIKSNLGIPWRDTTYRDTFKFGGPDSEVRGIATTMFGNFDVVKRAAMYIKLNDMVVGDNYIQPIASRARTTALKAGLTAHLSGWDNDLWQLASWYREA